MKEPPFPETPGRRAAAYWFIDGLPEIVAGIGFVGLSGVMAWFDQIRPHSWSDRMAFVVFGIISLMVVFDHGRSITLFLKSRMTFPRTGYVRPPSEWEQVSQGETVITLGLEGRQRPPNRNVTHFRSWTIGVIWAGYAVAGVIAKPIGLPIATSTVAVLLYALHRNGERPYHWASVLLLPAAGIGAMLLHMQQDANACAAVLIGGVWLAVQGGWRLITYVCRHPLAPVESLRP